LEKTNSESKQIGTKTLGSLSRPKFKTNGLSLPFEAHPTVELTNNLGEFQSKLNDKKCKPNILAGDVIL
jgi:hypothetical protein